MDLDQGRPIFEAFQKLQARWPVKQWTWDDRLNFAVSTFKAEQSADARAAIAEALAAEWNDKSIATASEVMQGIVKKSGGLRPGQLAFEGTNVDGLTPFGLWWPWSGGKVISLRVGISGGSAATGEMLRRMFVGA